MAPPVLLVHGLGTSFDATWRHNGWVDLLGDLGRSVIGVDLLGHGDAPKPHDPAAYEDLTTRVFDAIADVDGPRDAIGFSLWAKTLLQAATVAPDSFSSLVVSGVGANLFRSDSASPTVAEVVRTGDDRGNPGLRYFAGLAELPGNDREALAACMTNGGGGVTEADLGRITCPVLVVLGDQDFTAPADQLVAALPDATYVELPRTDHAKTPKSFAFIDAALDFLRTQDG